MMITNQLVHSKGNNIYSFLEPESYVIINGTINFSFVENKNFQLKM